MSRSLFTWIVLSDLCERGLRLLPLLLLLLLLCGHRTHRLSAVAALLLLLLRRVSQHQGEELGLLGGGRRGTKFHHRGRKLGKWGHRPSMRQ